MAFVKKCEGERNKENRRDGSKIAIAHLLCSETSGNGSSLIGCFLLLALSLTLIRVLERFHVVQVHDVSLWPCLPVCARELICCPEEVLYRHAGTGRVFFDLSLLERRGPRREKVVMPNLCLWGYKGMRASM